MRHHFDHSGLLVSPKKVTFDASGIPNSKLVSRTVQIERMLDESDDEDDELEHAIQIGAMARATRPVRWGHGRSHLHALLALVSKRWCKNLSISERIALSIYWGYTDLFNMERLDGMFPQRYAAYAVKIRTLDRLFGWFTTPILAEVTYPQSQCWW
jgi:hypothetical protein